MEKLRCFSKKSSRNFTDSIGRIIEGVRAKNVDATLLFEIFSKAFDSTQRVKMEQILLGYGPPKETVTAIMMPNKTLNAIICSTDIDKDFFDIVSGVVLGDT